ncbi:cell division protein FtsQ/DivIB [Azospirillum sp.]|uniref:cell division protein FtsQ/DivIB n=1 Tax=Azospirillum sp. TaxID=34012 RepID=UPI003D75911C
MSARLSAPPRNPKNETPAPPRAMAHAAQRGNRRRAFPRWAKPALKATLLLVPVLALAGFAAWHLRAGTLGMAIAEARSAFITASADAGLSVNDVAVHGRTATDPDIILRTLGVERGAPILDLDLTEAKARLEQLPWVASAAIERHLPDTLYVRLSEREPMAIWQNDRRFTVIDREGRPLADAAELARRGNRDVERLPQVVGANAPGQVQKLLAALDRVPAVAKRLKAATWVGDRRWNLTLDNGVVVKLPEGGMLTALRQLADMDATGKVLDRDIVVVDLRQPDRMVLQTSVILPGMEDEKKKPGKKT